MKTPYSIPSFLGQVSPRVWSRTDQPGLQSMSRILRGWIPRPQGGMALRAGSQRVGDAKNPTEQVRYIDLNRGGDESDAVLEVGAGYIRVWQDKALLPDPAAPINPYEVTTDYVEADLENLRFAQRNNQFALFLGTRPIELFTVNALDNISREQISVIPERNFDDENSPGVVDQVIQVAFTGTWADDDTFTCAVDNVKNKVLLSVDSRNTETVGTDGETSKIYEVATYRYSTDTAEMEVILANVLEQSQFVGIGDVSVSHAGGTTWDVTLSGDSSELVVDFEVEETAAATGEQITETQTTAGKSQMEPAWSYPLVVTFGGDWYQCENPVISATDPSVDTANWTALGSAPSWESFQPSAAWVPGESYSPQNRGFPTVGTFYQQRLVAARDATLWGSQIGKYRNFNIGNEDNEGYSFDLDTRQSVVIKWLESNDGLIAGTSSGDWVVNNGGALIATGKISAKRYTGRKSEFTDAVAIDDDVFYVEQGGKRVRRIGREQYTTKLDTKDVSLWAEDLVRRKVKRMAVMYVPETIVFCLMDDGTVIGNVYAHGEAGWFDANFSGVEDLISVFNASTGEDEIHMVVNRPEPATPSTNKRTFEAMPYPFSDRPVLDAYIYGTTDDDVDPDTTTVSGLDHLEGLEVWVLARNTGSTGDGFVQGSYTVASGRVIITQQVDEYWIGLFQDNEWQTMECIGDGLWNGYARRWAQVYGRLYQSAVPLVNGNRLTGRASTAPMSQSDALKTGDFRAHTMGQGDGALTIVQDIPKPTEVTSFYGQLEVGNA